MIELTLGKDEIVKTPGVYKGVPISKYHGAITDGPGISSSGLRTIDSKSPAHYWARSPYNPNRLEQETKAEWNIGKAAHTLLLGEDGFREQYAVRPEKWKDWRANDAKEWRAEQELAGRTVITSKDIEAIKGMARALEKEPLIQQGLLQGKIERSLFWRDPITGLWLKSRPDVIPTADGVLVDFKTTTNAHPDAVQRACMEHGYPMQGALAGMGLLTLLGIKMTDFVLIFAEKEAPFAYNITPIDQNWIWFAERQIRRAIDKAAKCFETGEWPGYQNEVATSMPKYLQNRLEWELEHGLLPNEENAA